MDDFSFFQCKNCRGDLDARLAVNGVVTCPYCNTPWTVPRHETASEAIKYLHDGNAALDVCRFGEAFTYFQKAAELDKNEPEAFFGMALASFKVQYLRDEVNNCLCPICHEISEKVFTEDKNYKKALELATVEQKKVYRRKGGEIDDIRDEFFALQSSGLSYDCFLCVKVTEGDGTHTQDYERANDIYYHLKDNGYKPFFSEREMKGRTGSAYEALILYALYTSECMLIVCSDEDYLQTKWVKNEYTRFINLMQEGGKERDALTFVFAGKPIEKLPSGKKIQGIDLTKPDAYSRITEYVQSHASAARKKREEEEKKREEEERKRREEEAAREQREAEEALRQYQYSYEFEIQGRALIKYRGNGGNVVIPDGVTSIGGGAFIRCTGLTEVTIPNKVTSIGFNAFAECTGLRKITIPDSVTSIGDGAFIRCTGLTEVTIPNRATSIGRGAFQECIGLTEVNISNSVTSIGDMAFYGCKRLTKITIPNSVTSIGDSAFYGCKGLEEITIPDKVISVGGFAFAGCTGLTKITIPDSVTSIGGGAFNGCIGLTEVNISNRVTLIDGRTFSGCRRLTKITIPESVTAIGMRAFSGCEGLQEITISGNMPSVEYDAFDGCTKLTKVTISSKISAADDLSQFVNRCPNLKRVMIPKRFATEFMRSELKAIFKKSYKRRGIHLKFI